MNPDSSDTPELPQADGPTTDAGAAAAPKKRVRAKKVVADASPAAAEVTAGEGEAAVAEAAAEPVKAPRKPRAPRKTAAVAEVSVSVAMPEHAAESESQAAPAPAVIAQTSDADAFADSSKSVNVDAGGDAPAQLSAAESPSSEAPVDREDRTRGRRRGRRGGGRGDEAERSDEAPVAVSAAVPVVMPDAAEVFASLVSGEFDVEPEGAAEPLADEVNEKRVLLPDADAPKLHKVLAQSGIGSRRDMEQMILEGRVTVNGEVAHTGMRISFGDRIAIDGKPARVRIAPPPPRLIAYHKPVGEVVTHEDPQQRPTVFRKLPRLSQGKWQSVGRLDINTEGLLLFTTSGDLANKLMHPRFGVEREYAVRVLGTLEKDAKERLLQGVEIEGQSAAFKSIEEGGGEGINRWYRVVIAEGRNREVRKLFDAVGLTVSRLIRVRYGCIVLPRGLKRGVCVDLGEADVKALRQLTGTLPGPRGEGRNDERAERGDQRGQGRNDREAPRGDRDGRGGNRGRADGARAEPRGGEREARGERPPARGQERRDNKPARGPGGPQGGRRQGPAERVDRGPEQGRGRGPRRDFDAGDVAPRELREPGDPTRIPNPLQQTYDKRAIQRDRAVVRDDDFEDGPIPNPLQQTYDKRFVQGARGQGGGGRSGKPGNGGGGAPRQPDPMQTSVGYIGADAFTRKSQGRGGGGGGRRGGGR